MTQPHFVPPVPYLSELSPFALGSDSLWPAKGYLRSRIDGGLVLWLPVRMVG